MKVIRDKKAHRDLFQIKIHGKYVTVAELVPWFRSPKNAFGYNLYFYYYGAEFEEGIYASQRINGNLSIEVLWKNNECWEDFLEKIKKIIYKKLYEIGNSILEEIKYIED